ncbi:MAG TPA: sigma-70 family RNA polymerase sigma factor [Caulobacteraceae bacterium]
MDAFNDRPLESPAGGQADEYGDQAESLVVRDQIERLFRSQAPRLLRFLGRRAREREEASDMLQESFLRLIRMAKTQVLPACPEAYLQRIASNLLRDRAKQRTARAEHLHIRLDEEAICDLAPSAEAVLEARDLLSLYEAAVLSLRARTQQIFLLHRRDGLTYAQIATEVGLSVSGVEKHMMKAIAHIDRILGRA